MKTIFIGLITLFLSNLCAAQMQSGFHYKIKKAYWYGFRYYERFDLMYTTDGGKTFSPRTLPKGKTKLKANLLQDEKKPILKVDFWGVRNPSSDPFYNDILDTNHYYFIDLPVKTKVGDITKYISIPYSSWEFGVTTIPLKYRFGKMSDSIPNETSVDVNAGIYIGRKWGSTRFFADKTRSTNGLSYTVGVFAAPMIIALAPETTRNKVLTKSNELGIGTGFAFMVAYRDINVGILGGYDIPVSGVSSKWMYNSRPWIGFGIGYKLALLGAGK